MSPEKIKRWSEAITEAGKNCAGSWKARLLSLLLLVFISGGVEAFAQGNPSSSQPNQNNNDSYPIRGAGDVRFYDYFPRYPAAACFGPQCEKNPKGKDIIENRESKKDGTVKHGKSGPVYEWPIKVKECISKVPTKRDEAINDHMLKTFGYPISDTQFQMIHRFDNQIMLEEMFDPERLNWTGAVVGATQMQDVANGAANTCRNQCASAIDFVGCSIYNFTIDESNKWNKVRNELFLPMAVLLLLPGAVLAQLRVIVAAGMPIQGGDVNPFEGITRSIVAIFLIPATYLVVNYGIDLNNSITYTIYSEYQRIFGTDMYKDALCAVVRAHPVRQAHEDRNAIDKPSIEDAPKDGKEATPASKNELKAYDVKKEDPNCNGPGDAPKDKATEMNSFLSTGQRALTNASNAGLGAAWNILCAFQVVFLMYLWFVGPVVAALWVYPSAQLRGALPSWTEGVITLCFWSLFWNTTVLLMACFKGIDETGTIIQSALLFLATASVKFAFDFAGLVKAAGAEAGGMAKGAAQAGGQGAGKSPNSGTGTGGGRTGQPTLGGQAGTGTGIGQDSNGANVATMGTGATDTPSMPSSLSASSGTGASSSSDGGTGGASGTGGTGTGTDGTGTGLPPGVNPALDTKLDANGNPIVPVGPDGKPLDPGMPPLIDPSKNPDGTPKLDANLTNNNNMNINALTGQPLTQQQKDQALAAMAAGVGPNGQMPLTQQQLAQMGGSIGADGKSLLGSNGQPLTGANGQALTTANLGTAGGTGATGGVGASGYNLMTGGQAGMIPPPGTSIPRSEALQAIQTAQQNAARLDAITGGTERQQAAAKLMDEFERAPTNGANMTMTPGLYQAMQAQQGDVAMGSMTSAQGAFSANFATTGARLDGLLQSSPTGQVSQQAQALAGQATGLYQQYQQAASQGPLSSSQLLAYNQQLSQISNNAQALSQAPGPMVDASQAAQARAALGQATMDARGDATVYSGIAAGTGFAGPVTPSYGGAPTQTMGSTAGTSGTTYPISSTSSVAGSYNYAAPAAGAAGYAAGTVASGYAQPGAPAPAPGMPAPGTPAGAPGYQQVQVDAGSAPQAGAPQAGAPQPGGGYVNASGYGSASPTYGAPAYGSPAPAPGGAPAPGSPAPSAGASEQVAYNAPSNTGAPVPYSGPAPTYQQSDSGYSAPSSQGYGGYSQPTAQPNYNSAPPPASAPAPQAPTPQYNPTPQGQVSQQQSYQQPYQQPQSYGSNPPPAPGPQTYTQSSPQTAQSYDYNNQALPQQPQGQAPAGNSVIYAPNNQPGPAPTQNVNYEQGDRVVNNTPAPNNSAVWGAAAALGGIAGSTKPTYTQPSQPSGYSGSGRPAPAPYVYRPSPSSSAGAQPPQMKPQQPRTAGTGGTAQRPAGQAPGTPGGVQRNTENLGDRVRDQTFVNKGYKDSKGKRKKLDKLPDPNEGNPWDIV